MEELDERLTNACKSGLVRREETGTSCCYAKQDKFWANDPNGVKWEVYYFLADAEFNDPRYQEEYDQASNSQCCIAPAARSRRGADYGSHGLSAGHQPGTRRSRLRLRHSGYPYFEPHLLLNAMTILPMTAAHWPAVRAIYAEGMATGNATFATEPPSWEEWHASHLPTCRLVAVSPDSPATVLGWAALTPVSGRCVYAGVAEVSVYVAGAARGQGLGRTLLSALVAESEQQGLWMLQAGIFPENAASVRLHEAAGFRVVGRRERIGQLRGQWRDTLLLERRSAVVGTAPATA